MKIGLILFVSSLLLGNTGDKSTNTANENQPHDAIASKSTKSNNSSFDDQLSEDSVQIPADFTATEALSNFSLSINGNAETKIKQNEYYAFTPIVEDPDTDQSLTFTSENIPTWAIFNPDDGSISGTPQIDDKGIYKDIYITVTDSTELSHTIGPFDIHVESYHFNENAITKINVCWDFLEKDTKYLAEHEVSETVKNLLKVLFMKAGKNMQP